ncbi:hypothetical protein JCM15831A_07950 [Asaia astilbis]
MSIMNISLVFLALGLWASIFLVKFKDDLRDWLVNRFAPSPPPKIPEEGIPEVPLPFRYTPQTAAETEKKD